MSDSNEIKSFDLTASVCGFEIKLEGLVAVGPLIYKTDEIKGWEVACFEVFYEQGAVIEVVLLDNYDGTSEEYPEWAANQYGLLKTIWRNYVSRTGTIENT